MGSEKAPGLLASSWTFAPGKNYVYMRSPTSQDHHAGEAPVLACLTVPAEFLAKTGITCQPGKWATMDVQPN